MSESIDSVDQPRAATKNTAVDDGWLTILLYPLIVVAGVAVLFGLGLVLGG